MRREEARVPTEVEFATKPALAGQMITRAVAAGVPASWVAGDEVYGADPALRATLRGHGLVYVMQIAANRQVPTGAGRCGPTSSPPGCPGAPGTSSPPAPAARAPATTRGPG